MTFHSKRTVFKVLEFLLSF